MNIIDLQIAFKTIYFHIAIKILLVIFNTEDLGNMFLSVEEVERLTGCKRKALQCSQLDKMHIAYFKNAHGEPIVTVSTLHGLKSVTKLSGWQSNAKMP